MTPLAPLVFANNRRLIGALEARARAKGGFYVEPEAKLMFVMRLRGLNDLHPKTRKILQLMRLRQIHNGIFLRVNKATIRFSKVEPHIMFGHPNPKTVRELVHKRGYGKVNKQRIPLPTTAHRADPARTAARSSASRISSTRLHRRPHHRRLNFLWPFKLGAPRRHDQEAPALHRGWRGWCPRGQDQRARAPHE